MKKSILFLLLISFFLLSSIVHASSPLTADNIITCAINKGIKLFSSPTCGVCNQQKAIFANEYQPVGPATLSIYMDDTGNPPRDYAHNPQQWGCSGVPCWAMNYPGPGGTYWTGCFDLPTLNNNFGCGLTPVSGHTYLLCGQATPTCSDGTPYGQCSADKPKYCCPYCKTLHDNYCYGPDKIVGTADDCGCPSGQTCNADGSCKASQNLLLNPSLETDSNNDGVPDYWSKANDADVSAVHDWCTEAHTGSRAICTAINRNNSAPSWHASAWTQNWDLDNPSSPFKRGGTYGYRMWYQTSGGIMVIYVGMWNSSWMWMDSAIKELDVRSTTSSTWTLSDWLNFTIPSDAAHIALGFGVRLSGMDSSASSMWGRGDDFEAYQVSANTCSDGTPYDSCSLNKPKYCYSHYCPPGGNYCQIGVLIDTCYGPDKIVGTADDCGCSTGICQPDGSCAAPTTCDSACKAQNFTSGTCEAGISASYVKGVGIGIDHLWPGSQAYSLKQYPDQVWQELKDAGVNVLQVGGGNNGAVLWIDLNENDYYGTYNPKWAENLEAFLEKADSYGMKVFWQTLGDVWGVDFGIDPPQMTSWSSIDPHYTPIPDALRLIDKLGGNNSLHHNFINDSRIAWWEPINEADLNDPTVVTWTKAVLQRIKYYGGKTEVSMMNISNVQAPYFFSASFPEVIKVFGDYPNSLVDYLDAHPYRHDVVTQVLQSGTSADMYTPMYNAWSQDFQLMVNGRGHFPLDHILITEFGMGNGYWCGKVMGGSCATSSQHQQAQYIQAMFDVANKYGVTNVFYWAPVYWNINNRWDFGFIEYNGTIDQEPYNTFKAATLSTSGSTGTCQSGESSIGQDDCSSNNLCCCKSNLVGYWKFDEGSGSTAYDSSTFKNNGALVNIGNCTSTSENSPITVSCPSGGVISSIDNAVYVNGSSLASCSNSYLAGFCNKYCDYANNCIGKSSCSFTASNANCGGDPCPNSVKKLILRVSCSNSGWVTGKSGKALQFNGFHSYVAVSDSNSLDITKAITQEAWIYPLFLGTRNEIATKAGSYYFNLQNGKLCVALAGISSVYNCTSQTIPTNQWSHVAYTWDGTVLNIYINGILSSTAPLSGTMSSYATILTVGIQPDNFLNDFNGVIDEVKVWNRALSADEIEKEYNSTVQTYPLTTDNIIKCAVSKGIILYTFDGCYGCQLQHVIFTNEYPPVGPATLWDSLNIKGPADLQPPCSTTPCWAWGSTAFQGCFDLPTLNSNFNCGLTPVSGHNYLKCEQGFTGNNFVCNYVQTNNLWECSLDYTNNLGEKGLVKFHFIDPVSGEVKSTGTMWTDVGNSGTVGSELSCNNYHGTYNVVWRAYRSSDTTHSNPVAFSTSFNTVTCS